MTALGLAVAAVDEYFCLFERTRGWCEFQLDWLSRPDDPLIYVTLTRAETVGIDR